LQTPLKKLEKGSPLPKGTSTTRMRNNHAFVSYWSQTISQRGPVIVPLELKTLDSGDVYIRALDPAYATLGPDEVQKF
jgi:hypothetical protein